MSTRNLAVARGHAPVANGQTWYTVPAGHVFIFKSLAVSQTGGAGGVLTVYVIDGAGQALVIVLNANLTSTPNALLEPWIVLNAGDSVVASVASAPITYWVSGALLPSAA